MTEDQARQVVLVQALESPAAAHSSPHWNPADADWATHQAVALVGEQATPERFVVARAGAALSRLLPRDPEAQRWLQRRWWHPAWLLLAAVLGLVAGMLVDQLGPPQQVNLLAPAVWALVAWNLLVCAAALAPRAWPVSGRAFQQTLQQASQQASQQTSQQRSPSPPQPNWRRSTSAWWLGLGRQGAAASRLWAPLAATLAQQRLGLVMHTAAGALALGLIAGLYLRGLVLDYRAGWQSTFADASTVQTALGWLLWPASLLTGVAVPDVGPLRLLPGQVAQASAAPWIHLLAATLLIWVVLPRALLALRAAWRAGHGARHFELPLNTPYFEGLHPLMRRAPAAAVRLLWLPVAGASSPWQVGVIRLLDLSFSTLSGPLRLHATAHGDVLQLHPTPVEVMSTAPPVRRGWHRWWPWRWADPQQRALAELQAGTDAVLMCLQPGTSAPAWLAAFERPVLVLLDAPNAAAPQLSLHALNDGWLRGGRLFDALSALLAGDQRLQRLGESWRAQQQRRMDTGVQVLADSLAGMACARADVGSGTGADLADAEAAARAALAHDLDARWRVTWQRLSEALGAVFETGRSGPTETGAATVHARLPEGRLALIGGATTGALTGLKADLLSGGLTMGAGLVTGLVLGALGSAGMARGINAARGTERSCAAWDAAAMDRIAQQLLAQYLVLAHELALPAAAAHVRSAWAEPVARSALADIWRSRDLRSDATQQAQRLSAALQPWLAAALRRGLGGP